MTAFRNARRVARLMHGRVGAGGATEQRAMRGVEIAG
jgi:hypothetical protein